METELIKIIHNSKERKILHREKYSKGFTSTVIPEG